MTLCNLLAVLRDPHERASCLSDRGFDGEGTSTPSYFSISPWNLFFDDKYCVCTSTADEFFFLVNVSRQSLLI